MLLQVVIGAVGNAPELAPAERETGIRSRWSPWNRRQSSSGAWSRRRRCSSFMPRLQQPVVADSCASSRTIRDPSPGLQKNSSSICSNSRTRKMKLPGVISLRKDLPIWQMPDGQLFARGAHGRLGSSQKCPARFRDADKSRLPCPRSRPAWVLNIRLNWRMPVKSFLPHTGQTMSCSAM